LMKAEDSRQVDARAEELGRNPGGAAPGAEADATTHLRTKAESEGLMEAVVSRGNLMLAYERVMRNKGSAGVDGRFPSVMGSGTGRDRGYFVPMTNTCFAPMRSAGLMGVFWRNEPSTIG